LGMGDLAELMRLAQEEIGDDDDMEAVTKSLLTGRFTLTDMYKQLAAVSKMGTLQKLLSFVPGMGGLEDRIDYDASQKKLERYRVIMDSMTHEEKEEPNIIKGKRIERIAKGSGASTHEVKDMLKQYNQSKKMMGSIGKDRKMRKKFLKQFGGTDLEDFDLEA